MVLGDHVSTFRIERNGVDSPSSYGGGTFSKDGSAVLPALRVRNTLPPCVVPHAMVGAIGFTPHSKPSEPRMARHSVPPASVRCPVPLSCAPAAILFRFTGSMASE